MFVAPPAERVSRGRPCSRRTGRGTAVDRRPTPTTGTGRARRCAPGARRRSGTRVRHRRRWSRAPCATRPHSCRRAVPTATSRSHRRARPVHRAHRRLRRPGAGSLPRYEHPADADQLTVALRRRAHRAGPIVVRRRRRVHPRPRPSPRWLCPRPTWRPRRECGRRREMRGPGGRVDHRLERPPAQSRRFVTLRRNPILRFSSGGA